jgi:predicted permease
MAGVFGHRLEQAGPSVRRRGWVWARGLVDLAVHASAEWLRALVGETGHDDGRRRMEGMTVDLKHGLRALRGAPVLSAVAVLTLALGVGASTSTFSVVYAVLLEGLPYRDAGRLVTVWPEENFNKAMVAAADRAAPALESVSGYTGWTFTLTGEGEPREIQGAQVSAHHFDLLGVSAALGRTFLAGEGRPGGAGVVVLSHDLWIRVFGGDPDVVGRTVDLSGAEYDRRTVVGILPAEHRALFDDAELWVPLEVDPSLGPPDDGTWFVNHRVARLAPGATREQAQAQVRRFAVDLQAGMPRLLDEEDARAATVQPLRTALADGMDDVLWVALGAVSLVLLIACANVANLLLARGEARNRDLAVRSALGADRRRVIGMLVSESGMLGVAGGGLGILLAYGLVDLLVRTAPPDFPRIGDVGVDGAVLGFAVGATLVATLLAGLFPALRNSRVDATASLGSGRGASVRRAGRLTPLLVGAQVALAVTVVVGSGLMLRSLDRLLAVDPGLRGERVLTFRANPPESRYETPESYRRYYDQILERVAALPGVASVGAINLLPGTTSNWSFPTYPEGVPVTEGATVPSANFRGVVPGYFETVGVPLREGRYPAATDDADAEPVLVVNEAFVREFWPGEDVLGRSVRIFSAGATPYRVVGVVGDVRQHDRKEASRPEMYVPHEQWGWGMSQWVMVRFAGDRVEAREAEVRDAVWSVDPDVPVTGMEELASVLGRSTRTTRFLAILLSAFGALALALGAVGVFGVTAYTVGRRTAEFGVRLALGGSRRAVVAAALGRSMAPVSVGLGVGLLAAYGASGLLESVLYGVEPTDLGTFAGVAGLLATVAVSAALAPAWRASRVDPVRVLDGE